MIELRDGLNTAKLFTKLDSNYINHLFCRGEDKERTAFRNGFGLYNLRVMPFGLYNAPTTFQSITHNILHHLLNNRVIIYHYNILICIEDVDKYVPLVQEVVSQLDKGPLEMKLKTSSFHLKKVDFVCYIISE